MMRAAHHRWTASAAIRLLIAALATVALLLPLTTFAAEDVYSERTLDLSRKLECPVCNGQTVADSHSGTAREMRNIIEEKVQAGESDDQIIAYFVDRYGESILAEPPKSGFNLTLWWAPVAMVLFGLLVVGLFLRERTARSQTTGNGAGGSLATNDPELERLARETLGETPSRTNMSAEAGTERR